MFSVIIPLYNKEKYIERAIRSVLKQTISDYEIVVVDDGSEDNSVSIIRGINNHKIRLIEQTNRGVSAARNKGVSEAKGDIVAFLDADDKWNDDFLENIESLIKKFPNAGAYCTAYNIISRSGKNRTISFKGVPSLQEGEGPIPNFFKAIACGETPICSSAVCVPKKVFEEIGGFVEGAIFGEDICMWAKIALKYKIIYSPQKSATYFHDSTNRTCDVYVPKEKDMDIFSFMLDMDKKGVIDGRSLFYAKEFIFRKRYQGAIKLLKAGYPVHARKWLEKCKPRTISLLVRKYVVFLVSFLPEVLVRGIVSMRIRSR